MNIDLAKSEKDLYDLRTSEDERRDARRNAEYWAFQPWANRICRYIEEYKKSPVLSSKTFTTAHRHLYGIADQYQALRCKFIRVYPIDGCPRGVSVFNGKLYQRNQQGVDDEIHIDKIKDYCHQIANSLTSVKEITNFKD